MSYEYKRLAMTIYNDVYDEHLFVFAAGLSYYFVLSLFPLLILIASILKYVPIPHLFEALLGFMSLLVPGDGMGLVRNIVSDVTSHKHTNLITLGLVFTVWTASSGFAAMIDGLDVVYRVRETRPVWKTRPIALGLAVLVGSLLLLALGLMIEGTHFGQWFTVRFGLTPGFLATWRYLRWSIAFVSAIFAVELLYHFGPNVKQRFRDSLPGAIVAVIAWIGWSYLLGSYFRHVGSLNKTYGILGAAIALYTWFYFSGFTILLGGEINFCCRTHAKGKHGSNNLRCSQEARNRQITSHPRRWREAVHTDFKTPRSRSLRVLGSCDDNTRIRCTSSRSVSADCLASHAESISFVNVAVIL